MNSPEQLTRYLKHLETCTYPKPFSELTRKHYAGKLRLFFEWLGDRPFTEASLASYVKEMQEKGLRPRGIKSRLDPIASYCGWLMDQPGVRKRSVPDLRRVWKPPLDQPTREMADPRKVELLFEAARSLPRFTLVDRVDRAQNLVFLSLAADCALRRCEIVNIQVADLELGGAAPKIHVIGKGRKSRWIPLNARAVEILTDYFKIRKEWKVVAKNPWLLPRDSSRRLDEESLLRMRHRLLQVAGLEGEKIDLHSFRHYRITQWLGVNGVNPKSVAQLAGHSDVATTMKYAHATQEEMLRAVHGSEGGAQHANVSRPAPPRRRRRRHPAGPEQLAFQLNGNGKRPVLSRNGNGKHRREGRGP